MSKMTMPNKLMPGAPELESKQLDRKTYDGVLRYLEHGFPNPLVRWHCHEECELHLIVATTGRLFVGDYIGEFLPGHLVLTGPRLPHNWISSGVPEQGVALRDMVVQFAHQPLEQAAHSIPELRSILQLLERSTYGIEFFDMGEEAEQFFLKIRETTGIQRFSEFLQFIGLLANATNYRLLSSIKMQSFNEKINTVLNEITENYCQPLSAEQMAEKVGMSFSKFSRFFGQSTGHSFTNFVNRIRINKACELLKNTDHYVTNICYDVGFNNVANFNRRFVQFTGVTPRKFRQQAEQTRGRAG